MSVLPLTLDRQLAQAVAITARLRHDHDGEGVAAQAIRGVDFVARGLWHVWRNRRVLTPTKLINMALVNVQFRLKTERVLGRPYRMKIEPTNICNTRCQLCPTGIGLRGRPRGRMGFDEYRTLIDQMKRYLVAVDLSMWGDPLIVPQIYDMIRYAHRARIWTYISSNLHAFDVDANDAERLVASGLNELTCSLHGATQATFQRYQPGKSLAQVVAKVRHLVDVRRHMGSTTPRIRLNFVVTRCNEHERREFAALAEELGCEPVFSAASMNTRFLDQDKTLPPLGLGSDVLARKRREHFETWLPRDDRYVLKSYRDMQHGDYDPADYNGTKLYNCDWPWRAAVINWDGGVVTCCGRFDPADDMGNAIDTRFANIWNGRRYRMARRSFKKRVSGADAVNNACASCPGYMV